MRSEIRNYIIHHSMSFHLQSETSCPRLLRLPNFRAAPYLHDVREEGGRGWQQQKGSFYSVSLLFILLY